MSDRSINRHFEGDFFSNSVSFIGAVNPWRKVREIVKEKVSHIGYPPGTAADSSVRDSVYKVHHLPENFIPSLRPAAHDEFRTSRGGAGTCSGKTNMEERQN
jgi:hypothetical protein